MKKMLALLLVLLLLSPVALAAYSNYADDADIADDVTGFVITAWDNEPFDDVVADMLIIQNVQEDADFPLPDVITNEAMQEYADSAWHWAEENRGYGDFVVAKKKTEDFLRFCYDGTTANREDTQDGKFRDYTSHYYPGGTEGQVERIFVPSDDRYTAYIKFFCWNAGVHRALRVEWIPDEEGADTGRWRVSNFYKDNVQDYNEMVACARFNYYDRVGGVEVTTQSSNLNVRATPGGEIIGSLKKGSIITVYKCEEMAVIPGTEPISNADGETAEPEPINIPFTLISKWTKPDADGNSSLEYFGWVASEYITEDPDWVWSYGD